MNVVFDHQIFEEQRYGGISRYFVELARELNDIPGVVASVAAPLHINEYLRSGALPGPHWFSAASFRGAARIRSVANRLAAPLSLRRLNADLVHATYFRQAVRRHGHPLVLTVYDMIHELMPDTDNVTAAAKQRAVNAADHVFCISAQTRSDLIRLLNVPEAKTSVTYLAHSMPVVDTDALVHDVTSQRPYVLYVGFRHAYKNFERFLRAFASSQALRRELDVLCFGGGEISSAEKALAQSLGLRGMQLQYRSGDDRALADAYTRALAFVYPSLYEGFGIPPLEAMARGCPVICSNISSIPEVVGDAAQLFDPTDSESIKHALETVCLDAGRRAHLRTAGLMRQAQFSWKRCAQETARVYTHLLA